MSSDGFASLLISVPACSFRKGYAREYLETEELPPPSTVYGFLLSLIGEDDRQAYLGTELAYALVGQPELSVVLRTAWRVKDQKAPPGTGANRRPDYQEILTGVELAVFLKPGGLAEQMREAGRQPHKVRRYGGLSLGESRDLVNDVFWTPDLQGRKGLWPARDPEGELPLPIWVDHVGSKGTVWQQFSLTEAALELPEENDPRWIAIQKKA
jgi:CRISPR-associated protein Cas5t